MTYIIRRKQESRSATQNEFLLMLWTKNDARFLEVCEDDYKRVKVGDTIEMLITVVPAEAAA